MHILDLTMLTAINMENTELMEYVNTKRNLKMKMRVEREVFSSEYFEKKWMNVLRMARMND